MIDPDAPDQLRRRRTRAEVASMSDAELMDSVIELSTLRKNLMATKATYEAELASRRHRSLVLPPSAAERF